MGHLSDSGRPVPLADLLGDAARGDQDAWQAIVTEHADHLWRSARSRTTSPAQAGDVVHLVWLRLLDRLDGLEPSSLDGWLDREVEKEAVRVVGLAGRMADDSLVAAGVALQPAG